MKIAYYPGCSLEATAREYDQSSRAACRALGLELEELEDWNCCGSTSAHNLNHLLAASLATRNIALAQKSGLDVAIPCAACYARLRKADHLLRQGGEIKEELEEVVDFKYTGQVAVISLLEAVVARVGLDKVREKVARPLKGLKVVCYYGCLMVRPPEVRGFDRVENPEMLDRLMEALGAEVRQWSYKTECCGAGLSLTRPEVVEGLVGRLAEAARAAGADALVTACPLCQTNLEMRQKGSPKIPSLYFTELLGIALGLPEAPGWMAKHLNDPAGMIKR
ncbi:MAG: CoB--CoM heterodisulfide reductase iron-sulfur subunit B family protein [Desulfocucumaceae bacterium]